MWNGNWNLLWQLRKQKFFQLFSNIFSQNPLYVLNEKNYVFITKGKKMKSNDTYKRIIFKEIMQCIPGTMRDWSNKTGISIGTFSGWKTGSHLPRGDSFHIFINFLSDYLKEDVKQKIYFALLDVIDVDKNGKKASILFELFENDFAYFIDYMVNQYDEKQYNSINLENFDQNRINDILFIKLKNWISKECLGKIETEIFENVWNTMKLYFGVDHKNRDYVRISYSLDMCNLKDLKYYIEKTSTLENCVSHIIFTFLDIGNTTCMKFLEQYHTYVYKLDFQEFEVLKNDYCFVSIEGMKSTQIVAMNQIARVLLEKILDTFYLIYKELLCQYFHIQRAGYDFLWNYLENGNYPYTMQRGMIFEQDMIDRILDEITDGGREKVDLVIDFNCIDGFFGLQLYQRAEKVLCVDSSKKVLDRVDEMIHFYNQGQEEIHKKMNNVKTWLVKSDLQNILDIIDCYGKADLLIMGLGSMSFFHHIPGMFDIFKQLLKQDGRIVFSCFNKDVLDLSINGMGHLANVYDEYRTRIVYQNQAFQIPVPIHLYSMSEFSHEILKYFAVGEKAIWSYPTLTEIFSYGENTKWSQVIEKIDRANALYLHEEKSYGVYNILHVKREK